MLLFPCSFSHKDPYSRLTVGKGHHPAFYFFASFKVFESLLNIFVHAKRSSDFFHDKIVICSIFALRQTRPPEQPEPPVKLDCK